MHSLACRKSSCLRCSITVFFTLRWKLKSNSSRVFLAGKRAWRMRASPPWLSRADNLGGQQQLHKPLIAPLLGAGAVGQLGQRPGRGGRLERPEQVREFGRRTHAGISWS